jgi:hypothetical protein
MWSLHDVRCIKSKCKLWLVNFLLQLNNKNNEHKGKVVLKVVAADFLGTFVRGKTGIGHITFRGLISPYLIFLSTSIITLQYSSQLNFCKDSHPRS